MKAPKYSAPKEPRSSSNEPTDEPGATDNSDVEMDSDGEHESDEETANGVYEMFCNLPDDQKDRVLKMCQEHVSGEKKTPMKPKDNREFTMPHAEDL